MVVSLYRSVGTDYAEKVIYPSIEEGVKASTARFTADQLITMRENVSGDVKQEITSRLEGYGLEVGAINIVNFQFSEQFNEAIESKVTAEQNALAEQRKLEAVKFQAQQEIEKAKGEAVAIQIINEQLSKSPAYLQFKMLDKWNGVMPLATGGATPLITLPANFTS